MSLEEIAIHEYAHHIHETENVQLKIGVRKERMDLSSGGFFLLFVVKQFKRGYTLMILLQI